MTQQYLDKANGRYVPVVAIDGDTFLKSYTLLSAASTTGAAATGIQGGDYIWRVEGTWGGATATLQMLALDGTTWRNVRNAANTADVSATADTSVGLGIGQGAAMRVLVSGASGSTSLSSTLAGL